MEYIACRTSYQTNTDPIGMRTLQQIRTGEKKKREKEKASDHINSVDIEIDSRCSLADSPI